MNVQEAVLMSIRPEWLWKILDGRKTIEVRKTIPAIEPPFRVYLYCTKGGDELWTEDKCGALPQGSFGSWKMNGTVCAEFVCDKIYQIVDMGWQKGMTMFDEEKEIPFTNDNEMCMSKMALFAYRGEKKKMYGLHITELRTFEKPLSYADFSIPGYGFLHHARPPQSWCYVQELRQKRF